MTEGLMNIFHLADSILNISFEKMKTSYWEFEYASDGGLSKEIKLFAALLLVTKIRILSLI
jgi:hypothetical protein